MKIVLIEKSWNNQMRLELSRACPKVITRLTILKPNPTLSSSFIDN